jgi:hypothetical protein
MVVHTLIEGYSIGNYSDSDVNTTYKYNNRYQNRVNDRNSLLRVLNGAQNEYNNTNTHSKQVTSFVEKQLPVISSELYRTQTTNDKYTDEIGRLNERNSELEFDNREHTTTINKLNYQIPPKVSEYHRQQVKSKDKSNQVLLLKKKEDIGAKKYHSLLMFQNEEIKTETYSQKNELTTADRKYVIHDSKIPYYVILNRFLLYIYIAIAVYIIYRVMKGMIVDNIYGKLVIILLISLYPIYMFDLEITIYDQYSLIKSMIRAEPYKPIKI